VLGSCVALGVAFNSKHELNKNTMPLSSAARQKYAMKRKNKKGGCTKK
jgi:hypothetical protein